MITFKRLCTIIGTPLFIALAAFIMQGGTLPAKLMQVGTEAGASKSVTFPEVTNSLGMTFVRIPAGSFMMGSESPEADDDEKPVHRVTISKAFEMQMTEMTQKQWKMIMGRTLLQQRDLVNKPWYVKKPWPKRGEGDNYPIYYVSWLEVQEFIRKLNERDPGKNYRLPTEAEWEYACRAGATGSRYGKLSDIAWYDRNSGEKTHPVGQKVPNAWGLYDMLGNVSEWCADWYGCYPSEPVVDPSGPQSGKFRVFRGGDWYSRLDICYSSNREKFPPKFQDFFLGFRLIRDAR